MTRSRQHRGEEDLGRPFALLIGGLGRGRPNNKTRRAQRGGEERRNAKVQTSGKLTGLLLSAKNEVRERGS